MKEHKYTIIFFIVLSFVMVSNSPGKVGTIDIPEDNKVELDTIWEMELESEQANCISDGKYLYIVTENHVLYMVDKKSGELAKSFKIDSGEADGRSCSGIAVYDGVMALNYDSKIIAVDIDRQETVFSHRVSHRLIQSISWDIMMYKDLIIYSNIDEDEIVAINFKTGEVEWDYGDELGDHGNFKLRQYKDIYMYRGTADYDYHQFDPATGMFIRRYRLNQDEKIQNIDYESGLIPSFEGIEDKDFELWLRSNSFGAFNITDKGYMYVIYKDKFYFHGTDPDLEWRIRLPKEMYITEEYGRYSFLIGFDVIYLLDLERAEVIWKLDDKIVRPPISFIEENRFYLPLEDGRYIVLDLSKLEK